MSMASFRNRRRTSAMPSSVAVGSSRYPPFESSARNSRPTQTEVSTDHAQLGSIRSGYFGPNSSRNALMVSISALFKTTPGASKGATSPSPTTSPQETATLLARAYQLHRAGRFPEAEDAYAQYLEARPDDAAALNNAAIQAPALSETTTPSVGSTRPSARACTSAGRSTGTSAATTSSGTATASSTAGSTSTTTTCTASRSSASTSRGSATS